MTVASETFDIVGALLGIASFVGCAAMTIWATAPPEPIHAGAIGLLAGVLLINGTVHVVNIQRTS